MDTEDMIEIMQDEVDIVARSLVPHIISITKREVDNISLKDQ